MAGQNQAVDLRTAWVELQITPIGGNNKEETEKTLKLVRYPEARQNEMGQWISALNERISGKRSGDWTDFRICFEPNWLLQQRGSEMTIGEVPLFWCPVNGVNTVDSKGDPVKKWFNVHPGSMQWKAEAREGNFGRDAKGKLMPVHIGAATRLHHELERHYIEEGSMKGHCTYKEYQTFINRLADDVKIFNQNEEIDAMVKDGQKPPAGVVKKPTIYIGRTCIWRLAPWKVQAHDQ